ncbi:sulfurtransferase TusA family protein [Pyrobaculum aerophilum]|uniref:Oxidoreductase n=1 Tax=Pyrobaculum aerophilum TaxID=13773 RepID=A0A371QZ74_9CREN|nr:sulfurtransferase TusA family protein [Pyrobaculum aerophilum]RFA96003.1 oxidoreductase [Pyrobaculum aerophilum]RFA97173.1 oxidoreductase [Pyrobaculum aerophilum]
MKIYEVKGPCPELGVTLARIVAELGEGEEALVVSKWRYVVNDLKNSASLLGLEIVAVQEQGDRVQVVVKKSKQALHL